jgi:hypothetical protein
MLGFVVPIKPQSVSKDWQQDNRMLERTVRSICGQISDRFMLVIVHHEKPEINFQHPAINYLPFPLPSICIDQFEDKEVALRDYGADYAEKMMDKSRKTLYGAQTAMERGCDYIMAVDSDDLVSNRLARYVCEHRGSCVAGWRITKGYLYQEGSPLVLRQPNIQNINGSTHIIRKDLVKIPDFGSTKIVDFNLFEAHGSAWGRLRDIHHALLLDYPCPGVIYVMHKNNFSDVLSIVNKNLLKTVYMNVFRGQLLTKKIRKEFGLTKL